LDEGVGPHRLQELILGHQAAGALHQITQDGECFGGQHDALVVRGIPAAPKALIFGVQPEWRKLLHDRSYPLATRISF
jgi:hypothetical protein